MTYGIALSLLLLVFPQKVSVLPQAILTEPEPSVSARLKGCTSIRVAPVQLSVTQWSPGEPITDFPKAEMDLRNIVVARLERIVESSRSALMVRSGADSGGDSAALSVALQERYDQEGRLQIDVFLVLRDYATLIRNGEKLLVPVYEAKAFVVKPSSSGVRQVVQDLVDGFARLWVEANRSSP